MKTNYIKYFFTLAPWPKRSHTKAEKVWNIILAIIYIMIAVLVVILPGMSIVRRILNLALLVIVFFLYPWILYFFFHAGLPAVEGIMIGIYKIRDAWRENKAPVHAPYDFFVARRLYETVGPLQGPRMDQLAHLKESLHNGLCLFMKDSKVLSKNMPEGTIETLATRLSELKLNSLTEQTRNSVSEEKMDQIGCYELLTVIFNVMRESVGREMQQKELAEWICQWFPGKYPKVSSVITYLSRINNTIVDIAGLTKYPTKEKSTQTDVPLLSLEEMKKPLEFFCTYNGKTEQ